MQRNFLGQATALSLIVLCGTATAHAQRVTAIDYLGQATFAARSITVNDTVGGATVTTTVGGLSGISYDKTTDEYYVLSDDQGNLGLGSPRFYTAKITAGPNDAAGSFGNSSVNFTKATTFLNGGTPFGTGTVDLESIALSGDRASVLVSDEGFANTGVTPKIHRFDRVTGEQLATYEAPSYYKSDNAADTTGIRNNTAFESVALRPDGGFLTGLEGPLKQEGSAPALAGNASSIYNTPNPVRLLNFSADGTFNQEFVYTTDALTTPITQAGQFGVSGLVDLLYTGGGNYLALERAFTITNDPKNTGYSIKLYQFNLTGATDVSGVEDLDTTTYTTVKKDLVLDFSTLNIPLDNLEGITFGPSVGNRHTLIVVADDNFSTGNGNGPGTPAQFTQVLAFGVTVAVPEPGTLALLLPGLLPLLGLARRKR